MNILRSVKAALIFSGSVDRAKAMLSTALHDAGGVPYLKTDWKRLYDNFHTGVTGQSTALLVPRAGAHPDERVVIAVIPAQEAGVQTAICLRLDAPPR